MRTPHTWFSTEFRGGTWSLRHRLEDLFAAPRRGPAGVLVPVAACVALLGLFVSCGAPVPAEAPAPDDGKLARSAILAAGQDGWDPDGVGASWTYLLDVEREGQRACALAFDSGVHAGGFGNLLLFTADPETGELLGPVQALPGDECQLDAWTDGTAQRALCTTVTTYQGVQTCGGGRFLLTGSGWALEWPQAGDYDAFWADRKGVLTHGGMDLYARGGAGGPQWVYEDTELFYDTQLAHILDAARRYVSGVVPAASGGSAEFQITGLQPAGRFETVEERMLASESVEAYALSYRWKEVGEDWSQAASGPEGLYLFCTLSGSMEGMRDFAYLLGCSVLPGASEADLQAAAERLDASHPYPLGDWTLPTGDSVPYTVGDVASAMDAAQAYFDGLPNNRLDRLWFDPATFDFARGTYLRGGGGSVNGVAEGDVMILLCDWTWLGESAVLDHGEARSDWKLIFIREGPEAPWVLDDQGY